MFKISHFLLGSDSCYLKQTVPFDIVDYEDPELPATRVMLQYMTDRMYDQIRGQGNILQNFYSNLTVPLKGDKFQIAVFSQCISKAIIANGNLTYSKVMQYEA